jgi:sortase (surface protein transpeptidase)
MSAAMAVLAGMVLAAGSTALASHPSPRAKVQPALLATRVMSGRIVPEDPPPPPPPPVLPAGAVGRLEISGIGVDAAMLPVGTTPAGAVDVTKGIWDVGWFNQSAPPGAPGSALIEGHLDWYTGPAVFWNLHRVAMGDEIDFVHADGTRSRFQVTQLRELPWNGGIPSDMVAPDGPSRLNLVTCAGTWLGAAHTYSKRLVVTASLI